jgi:ubiquinone/menaquinone biosynthesis C-methylase UbiE
MDGTLQCHVCSVAYPILDGIPNFLVEDLTRSTSQDLRIIGKRDSSFWFDLAARVYEPCIYPIVCNLFGGWHSTCLRELARDLSAIIGPTNGVILDVACGPGTYGRRVASNSRSVYGVDASMSMLRQGARYVERDHVPDVHLARAKVEALPFRDGLFDAAICAGSLNHFPDTVLALREICRTMKAGAPLAVMCFAVSNKGLFKYRSIREKSEGGGGHIFKLPQLNEYVAEAGFGDFHSHAYGSILVFSARKR